jgi:hypothetical protein
LRWGGSWIPHRKNVLKHLLPLGPPFYSFGAIFTEKSLLDDEKSELIRFLTCLKLWETTPGAKIISPAEVWILSLQKGAEAAEILDDMFSLTWREKEMESYNFCFPARFLPRFEEASNDIEWSLQSTYADESELQDFRSTLRDLLESLEDVRESIKLADDRTVLDDRTTTTSYIHSQERKMPHWEASLHTEKFETKKLCSLRCVVNVYPGGTRDTIIADKAANNSIRWLDRSITNILTFVPESAVTRSPTSFEKRKKDIINTKGWHVLRDIKKCGLTYNTKDLFPILKEELNRFIPDIRWERFNIFQQMEVYDDDYVYFPQRGYGLGMANAAVTLCNIVIYYMVLDRLNRGDAIRQYKSKGIFGNDDSDVVFYGRGYDTKKVAEEYLNFEHEIQGRLGNLTNLKKSVVKPYALFYEEYGKRGWHTKESLVCNALACAYLAPDIRVAKNYIHSQSDRFSSKWAMSALYDLAEFWGGEFFDFKSELKIHYEVGGWLDYRSLGLKTSTVDICRLIDDGIDPGLIGWAVQVCRRYISNPKPEFKTKGWVSNSMYEGPACKSDSRIQIYTLAKEDLVTYFKKLTTFQRNSEKRLRSFRFRMAFPVINTREEILKFLLKGAAWHQIPNCISQTRTWRNDLQVEVSSELAMKDTRDLDPENLVKYLIYPDKMPFWLQNQAFKMDQKIPLECLAVTVTAEMGQLYAASQFSNSGALAIYEFFTRNATVPDISLGWGTCKLIQAPDPKEYFFSFTPSRHKKEIEKKITAVYVTTSNEGWGDTNAEIEQEVENDEFSGFLSEFISQMNEEENPPSPARIDTSYVQDFHLTDTTIDRLLDIDFSQTENLGSFIASQRWAFHAEHADEGEGQAEPIDLYDDNEDLDFSLFGEE